MPDEPIWRPDPARAAASALARFMRECAETPRAPSPDAGWSEWHRWSCDDPSAFWGAVWQFCGVIADTRPDSTQWGSVLENGADVRPPGDRGGPRWFDGSRLNFAENLLRHRGPQPALVWRGEDGSRREFSRDALCAEVSLVAGAFRAMGLAPGDRVAGFLPNVPEAVVAMLAAAACGAVWSSCSPDFGVRAVLDRFGQIAPRVLVVVDGYRFGGAEHDCLERAREIASAIPSVERVVVVPFLKRVTPAVEQPRAGPGETPRGMVGWQDFARGGASRPLRFERLPFDHPLYILYSSGTTGPPKCLVHGAGGTLLQHLKELELHLDLREGERIFYFTTCGWMMWNWLVSALAVGATVVLYDGAAMPPGDLGALWRMAAEERLNVFGTSAKFLALSEKSGLRPAAANDLGALRTVLSTGSPLAPQGFDYVASEVGAHVQLSSISGGTDIVSCFVLGNPVLPVWRGELQCAGLGMAVEVFDDSGHAVRGVAGELVCTKPFPSMPVSFWSDADGSRYRSAYFARYPGVWRHGDWAERTSHDGFVIYGRSDATLNPGGVRIGSAEIYRQVEQLDEVVESVVVGQAVGAAGEDVRIVLFVRLRDGAVLDEALRARIRARIREHASPHHVPKVIAQVSDIPRTISGKITEMAVRDAVHGREVKNVDSLANPESLELFRNRPELRL